MKNNNINTKPWAMTEEEVFLSLGTSKEGLSEKEAESRLSKFGTNTFHNKEKVNPFVLFLKQFLSPLIFLLVSASVITIFLKEWMNTAGIVFAILINVGLGFWHEYNAENTLEKLKGYIKERAKVVREGKEKEIDSAMIVPGDLIKISYGSRVPADARVLSVNNFQTDEAILTGESIPVYKEIGSMKVSAEVAERKNIAHSGTLAVQGFATAVVYATGNHTEIGKIAGMVSKIDRVDTPLKRGMNKLAWLIFCITLLIVVGIVTLGVIRGESLFPMLVLSAAVAVGAVPESLPIVLTVILAIGATRIAEKKGIVRKLTAAETLGSTTLIMTDKTGTLTLADMQLTAIYSREDIILEKKKEIKDNSELSGEEKNLLNLSLSNLDLSVENPEEISSKWSFKGKPFEVNIAKTCVAHGVSLDELIKPISVLVLPFNSTNKFSIALEDGEYIVMGAPDILLKKSNLSKDEYLKIEKWIEKTSEEGKRLIGIASFPKKEGQNNITAEDVEGIKFLGAFVFYDPLRPEVPEAIKNIEDHGIKIVLVTGDLKGTAVSLAREIGWKIEEDEVILGADMRTMSNDELSKLLPHIKIFARVTPEDKFRVGKLYQKLGEVVAMTGDGVNDAPALKAMDIGISVGSGSDVAKSAADLVLLDDNFHTISMAIDEGRKILSNIRKAVAYMLSSSFDMVFVIGGGLVFALPLPLTALQIIWINLFTGSLPALAFAFDKDIDKQKYSGKDLKLVFSKEVKILALGVGALTSILLFVLYYVLHQMEIEMSTIRSVMFTCLSSYILVISFSFRSLRKPIFSYNIFSNAKLNWSIFSALLLLILTFVLPFMRDIFEMDPFPLNWLPFVFLWLVVNILLVEGAKYVFRKLDI
ncbi:MAG: HAD-IC family P-type ATPase [Candidatus Pacebacteria bacterium]|nr:HAD-IC family P-type ATPase [Candidatus Paceibacterota bacterium]MCF7862457.1 HAD-IC family P-type ATPase [Candidatus Paceibacterota bacterium]